MVYTYKNKLTTNITIEIINMINPNMVMALKMLFLVFFLVVTVLTTCFCDTNNIATAGKIIGMKGYIQTSNIACVAVLLKADKVLHVIL